EASLDAHVRHAHHRLITQVPNKAVQTFVLRQYRIRSRTRIVPDKLLVSLRRKIANNNSGGVFDLERDLVVLLQLGKLIVKNNSCRRINSSERTRTRKLIFSSIEFAATIHQVCAVRVINREYRPVLFVLAQHTQVVEDPVGSSGSRRNQITFVYTQIGYR